MKLSSMLYIIKIKINLTKLYNAMIAKKYQTCYIRYKFNNKMANQISIKS